MEHIALYRQFRPMNFDEIVEQKAAVASLRQSVITGRIGHAYLFCGQRGTGKTSIARVFSRAINCESPVNGNPCNSCPTCKGILDGSLMDVIEIDAASNTSVENIRKISEEVNFAPSKAPHKVYIIDEVHMISSGAFNALLKTLEEPPAHAVFLFATTEPHRIPPTVLSRCQRYDFRRIPSESIIGRLKYICDKENINAADDALRLIASLSDGAMRDAISVLDQAASAANGKLITAEDIENVTGTVDTTFLAKMAKVLIEGKFDELVHLCAELADSGRDTIRFALDLADYFRNLLIIRVVPNPTSLVPASASVLKEMYDIANTVSAETLVAFIANLSAIISDLKWSPSVRTSFDIAMIRLCGRKMKTEVVPLKTPNFEALQAKAVEEMNAIIKKTSSEMPSATSKAEEPSSEPIADTTESAKTTPEPVSQPVAEVTSETEQKTEPASEVVPAVTPEAATKAEPEAEPEAVPAPSEGPAEPVNEVQEVIPEEPVPAPISTPIVPTNGEEPTEDEEDKPLENQMDLFSMVMGNPEPEEELQTTVAEPVAEPVNTPISSPAPEAEPAPTVSPAPSGNKVFANLSASFLDDDMPFDAPAKAEPVVQETVASSPEQEEDIPTPSAWETGRSSLATALSETPIAEVKPKPEPPKEFSYNGADTSSIWEAITGRIEEDDFVLCSLLRGGEFRIMGDGGYIVFEDKDSHLMNDIKMNPNFKRVSTDIKSAMSEIKHVYLCTETQFGNALKSSGAPAKGAVKKANELITRSQQLGINTEIHFGDN